MFDDLLDELGEVILQENPHITATIEECMRRIDNREEQTGFWKEVLDRWEQEGRI